MSTPHDKAFDAARKAFRELSGLMIYLPSDGDMDDFERGRYEALKAALSAYVNTLALHAPLPIAGKGDEGWKSIKTADKDAHRLMLGIVRKGVLEESHIGGYRYALSDDEISCWWSDQSDDEIVPTHWCEIPVLPAPPSLLSEDTEGGT